MEINTLKYYNHNAENLCKEYDAIDFNKIQKSISIYLVGAKKVLEIGCGSGRDANYMTNNGFDIIGIDGSEEMIDIAIRNFSNLKGQLIHSVLPDNFPSFKHKFDGFYSIGTLMHFEENDLEILLAKINEVLLPKSPVYISVSGDREHINDERFFLNFSKADWINVFERNNFVINEVIDNQDVTGRGIEWYSFLMETKSMTESFINSTE